MSTPAAERDRPRQMIVLHRDVKAGILDRVKKGEAANLSRWIEIALCERLGMKVPPLPNDLAKERKRARAAS